MFAAATSNPAAVCGAGVHAGMKRRSARTDTEIDALHAVFNKRCSIKPAPGELRLRHDVQQLAVASLPGLNVYGAGRHSLEISVAIGACHLHMAIHVERQYPHIPPTVQLMSSSWHVISSQDALSRALPMLSSWTATDDITHMLLSLPITGWHDCGVQSCHRCRIRQRAAGASILPLRHEARSPPPLLIAQPGSECAESDMDGHSEVDQSCEVGPHAQPWEELAVVTRTGHSVSVSSTNEAHFRAATPLLGAAWRPADPVTPRAFVPSARAVSSSAARAPAEITPHALPSRAASVPAFTLEPDPVGIRAHQHQHQYHHLGMSGIS